VKRMENYSEADANIINGLKKGAQELRPMLSSSVGVMRFPMYTPGLCQ
jgi:hypothetical protein